MIVRWSMRQINKTHCHRMFAMAYTVWNIIWQYARYIHLLFPFLCLYITLNLVQLFFNLICSLEVVSVLPNYRTEHQHKHDIVLIFSIIKKRPSTLLDPVVEYDSNDPPNDTPLFLVAEDIIDLPHYMTNYNIGSCYWRLQIFWHSGPTRTKSCTTYGKIIHSCWLERRKAYYWGRPFKKWWPSTSGAIERMSQ